MAKPEDAQEWEKDSESQEMQSRNHDMCSAIGIRNSDKGKEKGVLSEFQAASARTRRKRKAICLLDVRNLAVS